MFKENGLHCLILILLCVHSLQVSLNEFITLSHEQKDKLDKFRELVSNDLPHDYMKLDVYLIRWLRDSNFNVKTAEGRLRNHISWRTENRMDTILEEDWTFFDSDYRVTLEGCDKEGKPVVSARFGDWDIRRAILSGRSQEMSRYYNKLFEVAEVMVRKMTGMGQNVTQVTFILDNDNFNFVQQGCLRCIPIYLKLLTTYAEHYPETAHKIIAINTPQIALPLWDVWKDLVPHQFKRVLGIYGKNKSEWSSILLDEIDRSQLSIAYGGVNPDGVDVNELFKSGGIPNCINVR